MKEGEWVPVTKSLLNRLDSDEFKPNQKFWVYFESLSEPIMCTYEWVQGRNPHCFISLAVEYFNAEGAHSIMLVSVPELPKDS